MSFIVMYDKLHLELGVLHWRAMENDFRDLPWKTFFPCSIFLNRSTVHNTANH